MGAENIEEENQEVISQKKLFSPRDHIRGGGSEARKCVVHWTAPVLRTVAEEPSRRTQRGYEVLSKYKTT